MEKLAVFGVLNVVKLLQSPYMDITVPVLLQKSNNLNTLT